MKKRAYQKVTVKVPAHPDPALAGQAVLRKTGAACRFFTESPEEVELTPEIKQLISSGNLVITDEPPVAHDPLRSRFVERNAKKDFEDNFLAKK
jgi:hypothetical protein